jgi:hypothetical protein
MRGEFSGMMTTLLSETLWGKISAASPNFQFEGDESLRGGGNSNQDP